MKFTIRNSHYDGLIKVNYLIKQQQQQEQQNNRLKVKGYLKGNPPSECMSCRVLALRGTLLATPFLYQI